MTGDPSKPSLEYRQWVYEKKREDAQRAFDRQDARLDMFNEAAVKIADSALRAGLLINGGAAVSVLAFIGSLATKDLIAVSQLSRVARSLEVFAFGVAAAVVGMGLSYLTHLWDADYTGSLKRTADFPFVEPGARSKRYRYLRTATHVLAVVAFLFCIGCFILGMISVRDAIEHLAH